MGGTGVVATCNCNFLDFELLITGSQYIDLTYQPCNGEQIQTIRYTSTILSNQEICVGNKNYNFSGTGFVITSNTDRVCLQANCQSCDCYKFFYKTSVDPLTYISYVPCNEPSSSRQIIGPFGPLSTGSFICSFPWTVTTPSGNLDSPPSGVITQVNSGSCQPFVSGTLFVGDLKGGGVVMYVTGSYPNQNGLIVTTASVATSSADFNRWGFLGTITGINNPTYGTGASNTAALRNYTPATGSIAANALTASINGYNDWFLPSFNEASASSLNNIAWPGGFGTGIPVVNDQPALLGQPQLYINTNNGQILTSNERTIGTTAEKQTFAKIQEPMGGLDYRNKNTNNIGFYGYRYFTSSLVP